MALPTVEEALALMLAEVRLLTVEAVPLAEADGRVLAQAVIATRDQPPFDASVMDGWAMRSADIGPGARLTIVGESAAGRGAGRALRAAETVRISTGAPLPDGADRVVMQEEAARDGDVLTLGSNLSDARFVRPRACDFAVGQRLLEPGLRLNPWRLALAASAGIGTLACGGRPNVAVLATGDELVQPGEVAGPDQIFDSAAPALAAFIVRQGGAAHRLSVAADTEAAIVDAISGATFDLLVTIGGASVGDHDRVKPALKSLGAVLHVEGCAVRPGRPVWFAVLPDGRTVLGLPGNPASALVCAELFLAPILARTHGARSGARLGTAVLKAALEANGPREHYMRARSSPGPDGRRHVTPFPDQDSSLVTVMASADVLIRRLPHAPAADVGVVVEVLEPTL